MKQTVEVGRLFRAMEAKPESKDDRTIRVSFSSDKTIVPRHFGGEILDHGPGAIRLDRIRDKGPVLMDHDTRDQVGVITNVDVEGGKAYADIKMSRSARGTEVLQDIRDGIRANVSVGYVVHGMTLEERSESSQTFRVDDWEPLEVSFTSVPADFQVGYGRSGDDENWLRSIEYDDGEAEPVKEPIMAEENKTPEVDLGAIEKASATAESLRQKGIRDSAAMINDVPDIQNMARQFQDSGKSVNEFLDAVIDVRTNQPTPVIGKADIGMTDKEVRQFSIIAACEARAQNDWSKAGFEKECSDAHASMIGQKARGFYVPNDVLTRASIAYTGTGDEIVATDHLAGSFIDILRNRAKVVEAGAQMMPGLVGNVDIPRLGTASTTAWVAEAGTISDSLPVFQTVSLTPKTIGSSTSYTRRMQLQSSPAVEQIVRNDLAASLAVGIDLAALHGVVASNEPEGLQAKVDATDIGYVVAGTNGLAPTYAHFVSLWQQVASANADSGSMSWMMSPYLIAKLMQTLRESSQTNANFIINNLGDPLLGFPIHMTNQVSDVMDQGTSTGVCSGAFFGDWSQMLIGAWGGLDLIPDAVTLGTSGGMVIRAFQDVDIELRHDGAFSGCVDFLAA